MKKRTITGALITLTVYIIIYFSYITQVLNGAMAVLCAFTVYEFFFAADLLDREGYVVLSTALAVLIAVLPLPYSAAVVSVGFVAAAVLFSLFMRYQQSVKLTSPFGVTVIALLSVLLFKAIPLLRALPQGVYYLTIAVSLSFVTDIFAYLVGSAIGKHKLIPSVSPNKSVEGSVGGILGALIIMLIVGFCIHRFSPYSVNYLMLSLYTVIASVVGQFGDLAMSSVKRICGVKDFGKIFPGHGGMLDRFDSQMFSVPFTYIFCVFIGGFLS